LNTGYADLRKEVNLFLSGCNHLVRLPLISDAETESLFSGEFRQLVQKIKEYDRDQGICAACAGRCCATIRCELYDPAFDLCPIFNLRPLLCRLHFCNKFDVYREDVKFIGDVFLEGLLEMEKQGSRQAVMFDSPPLAQSAPALVDKLNRLMSAFREGRLDRPAALLAILNEAESYRIAD